MTTKSGSGPVKKKGQKVIATFFFFFLNTQCILLVDFVEGQIMIFVSCESILKLLLKALVENWPGKPHQRALLHHTSAPAYSSDQTDAALLVWI